MAIIGRFFCVMHWYGVKPHTALHTERCIEVRPYCSTNWKFRQADLLHHIRKAKAVKPSLLYYQLGFVTLSHFHTTLSNQNTCL